MTNIIKLRKGLDLKLAGEAEKSVQSVAVEGIYALVPDDFTGLVPKVVVKAGETVKAGEPLFVNKKNPAIKFVSPVSGEVTLVERGKRRKVMSVQVKCEGTIEYKQFDVSDPSTLSSEQVKDLLLESGLFGFFKQRPYDVVADPSDAPKAIFISTFSKMPLAADFNFVLKGQEKAFQTGINALSKLAKVHLGIASEQISTAVEKVSKANITAFEGANPSGNVGVQINHIDPINKGEVVWTLGAEEVIFIGRFFMTGQVDLTRIIALGGSQIKHPNYRKVLIGTQLSKVLANNVKQEGTIRLINGNPLVGVVTNFEQFLGAHTTEITAIPEGNDKNEMLGWIMPRLKQFSVNHSYFSWLFGKNKSYDLDARIKGGTRHMIMSGEYDKVFPMDIYPEQLIKAILSGDIDRMEMLGMYEVAPEDFAVAEFVDSSKLELQRIVREGLDAFRKEMA